MKIVRMTGVGAGLVLCAVAMVAAQAPSDQWPNHQHNSNYSALAQITPENVSRLVPAWTHNYGAGTMPDGGFVGLDYRYEIQPLHIGGVLYITTPASTSAPALKATVTALEPETGRVIWKYESPRNIHGRGLAYWPGNGTVGARLYFATDKGYLVGLDIRTGRPAEGFGRGGELDAYIGVVSPAVGETRRDTYTIPNPVVVYRNLLIAGGRPGEQPPPQPRGDIRAFDAVTGALVWEFHVIPQPGEANYGTWPDEAVADRSGANMWSTMTVDAERGLVFAPLGDANRPVPGNNLYTASIVALDAATGRLRWFHQLVHHDVWDFDLPTPPLLVDVRRDGRVIPAVLQTGKMNYVYVFDRVTGEPLHGMEERPVPQNEEPGEWTAPTQPFPLRPGPIGRVGMTRADINKVTPEVEKACTQSWDTLRMVDSGAYWRPTARGAQMTFPSSVGGPNWGPLSYNPELGYVFINLHNSGSFRAALPPAGAPVGAGGGAGAGARGGGGRGGRGGDAFTYRLSNGTPLPCYAGPYGELVAVDVNRGEIVWKSTLGIDPAFAPLGEAAVRSGTANLGGSIATAGGLVFIGATNDRRFRAFDARTGREVWSAELPASAHSTPITYLGRDGRQYVVVPAGGGTSVGRGRPVSDSLVAFSLPR